MKDAIRINDALDRIALGRYSALSMDYCCNRIAWLARFRKVSKTITDALADKATDIINGNYYGDEPYNKYLEEVL